jgi:hypothetical protein
VSLQEPRIRVSAILRWADRILLIRHEKGGRDNWMLPGSSPSTPKHVVHIIFSGDLTGQSLEAVTSRDAAVRGHRLFDVRDLDGIALHPPIQRFLRRWQPGDPVAYLGALWAP